MAKVFTSVFMVTLCCSMFACISPSDEPRVWKNMLEMPIGNIALTAEVWSEEQECFDFYVELDGDCVIDRAIETNHPVGLLLNLEPGNTYDIKAHATSHKDGKVYTLDHRLDVFILDYQKSWSWEDMWIIAIERHDEQVELKILNRWDLEPSY